MLIVYRTNADSLKIPHFKENHYPGAGHFGNDVSIDSDLAIVGDFCADPPGFPGSCPGAAYTYRYNGKSWDAEDIFLPDFGGGPFYGDAVAVSGSTALISATGAFGQAGEAYFIELPAPAGAADLNCDGVVDGIDLGNLLANWSIPPATPGCAGDTPCASDINNDGLVNGIDLGILLANWTL